MPFTSFLKSWLLVHLFRYQGQSYPMNSTTYLALFDDLDQEVTGQPGYARAELTSDVWAYATNGKIANDVPIVFSTATGDWERPVQGWGLFDASNNLLAADLFSQSFTVKAGDVPLFIVGALEIVLEGLSVSGALSNLLENALLDHVFGKVEYTPPENICIGLLTADPGDGITNTNANELPTGTGTGYLRAVSSPDDWEVGTANDFFNIQTISFPKAITAWGTVSHFALFSTYSPQVSGHALMYGPLTPERYITQDSEPRFSPTTAQLLGIDGVFADL